MTTGTPEEIAGRLAHAERKAREWQEEATKLREVVMATEGIKPLNTNLDPETAAIFRDNYGPGLLVWAEDSARRIAALETQVRIMEKILEKLVTLHPEAQEAVSITDDPDFFRINEDYPEPPPSSQDQFYAHREAKLKAERDAEDLYLQRRRNFPLDPPSSADSEWDDDL